MTKKSSRVEIPEVARAIDVAASWGKRTGRDPREALGAAWLAIQKDRLHLRPPCHQEDALGECSDTCEEVPAELAEAMHPQIHPDEAIMERQFIDMVREVLLSLPPRTERLLRLRYGLGGQEQMTLEAIGKDLGGQVGKERARLILNKGLRTIRHPTRTLALRKVALGDLGAFIDEICRKSNITSARAWLAAHQGEETWETYQRRKTERRHAEQAVTPKALAQYKKAFGKDWYLRTATELMAANDESRHYHAA